jgi:hypothetical protein
MEFCFIDDYYVNPYKIMRRNGKEEAYRVGAREQISQQDYPIITSHCPKLSL